MPRLNLDKDAHPWTGNKKRLHRNGYGSKESEQVILHLHAIEKKIRDEIRREQVFYWTPQMIKARYG